jgi:type IV secretory pathway VirB2 component (pilin)
MKNSTKKALVYTIAVVGMFAATGAHAEPWDDGAKGFTDILYGPLGTTIAILGLAGAAIAGFAGKMEWTKVLGVIASIIVFFSAPAIVSYFKAKMNTSSSASAIEYVAQPRLAMATDTIIVHTA